jgi:RNA polymerase sigma factor (TIGR02999 family)
MLPPGAEPPARNANANDPSGAGAANPNDPAPANPNDPAAAGPVTILLRRVSEGDPAALEKLMRTVYDELHSLAARRMRGERAGHTLQPTALVNEAYVRLLSREDVSWQGKGHFFRAAADAMRKILIDYSRGRNAAKRGGGKAALSIASVADALEAQNSGGLLVLDAAIERLANAHARAAEVVRLKFYAGLGDADVALAIGASERSVRREWSFARAWLHDSLESENAEESP